MTDALKSAGTIRTVVFDLDGTLLDTLDDLACSVNYALREYGLSQRSRIEIRRFLGNGVRRLVHDAAPEDLSPALFEQVFACFKAHYMEHNMDSTRPFPGIVPLLETLSAAGLGMAIVSNKLDAAVKQMNKRFFRTYIPIAIGEQSGIRRKPAPDTVLEALRQLGGEPSQAVYVGDSEVDLQTARNAGMPCISVSWGFRDRDYLEAQGASILADTPAQIAAWLGI